MVKCGSLWPRFRRSERERQLPLVFAMTFLHSASWFCSVLFISSMMWEKELKRNRVLLVIMWVTPGANLPNTKSNGNEENVSWRFFTSKWNLILATQTQTWYLGDIGVWPHAFMEWGWNPDSKQMTRSETSSPKSYFSVIHQFFSPPSC